MRSPRFLIVDESQGVRTCTRQLLEGFGFDLDHIETCSKPHEAAPLLTLSKPDFLFTDWFPKESQDGMSLFQDALLHNPNCRLALMGREAGPEHQQQAHAAGALFLLGKPFTAVQLKDELAAALGKAQLMPSRATTAANSANPLSRDSLIQKLAPLPQYKPGDSVFYQNRSTTVKYAILRRGEMVVRLDGVNDLVPITKLQRQA